MPYKKIEDLPEAVKKPLPKHAQEIFLKVFNNSFKKYDSEESAFKVAWGAVKKVYSNNSEGKWVKKKH
jgi:cation transport regulator